MSDDSRSTPTLLSDLVTSVTELFRSEIRLLRAEMSEKSNQAVTAVGVIASGVVLALVALNVLAAALVAALVALGLSSGWASVIVGGVLAIVAFSLVGKGARDLKASNFAPERTARAAAKDTQMLKEHV